MTDRKKMVARVCHFPLETLDILQAIKKKLQLASVSDAIIIAVDDYYKEAIEPDDDGTV